MPSVTIKPLLHNNTENIAVCFASNSILNAAVKKIKGIKWSQSNKCWYLPLSKENYATITAALKEKATIENRLLKTWLEKRRQVTATLPPPEKNTPHTVKKTVKPLSKTTAYKLSPANLTALEKFISRLKLKAYSASTITTYRNEFLQLLQLIKQTPVDMLTPDDLKRYMLYTMEKEGISENTAHSRLNALKFYFEQVLGKEKFFWEIPRPKKPIHLPNVLGENDLIRLFKALTNKKHKAILFTAYSAGLRVSETVKLKIKDIDSDRMQIKVEDGKGKKDRYVGLSPVLLDVLRNYISQCKTRPLVYLFESEIPGEPYSPRAAQKIFQRAKENAGIKKEVSFHSLRHSFATHMLEKGIDIRYIKDILGHFDIKTTERYTHVSKAKLTAIVSPLDDLYLKGDIL